MVKIQYKNLQRSEFVDNLIVEKMETLSTKHPELDRIRTYIWLEMQNSWSSNRPASFSVRAEVRGPAVGQFHMNKTGETLYEAIAELTSALEDKIAKLHDKKVARKKRATSISSYEYQSPE